MNDTTERYPGGRPVRLGDTVLCNGRVAKVSRITSGGVWVQLDGETFHMPTAGEALVPIRSILTGSLRSRPQA